MLRFLRRRSARTEEIESTACQWCRTVVQRTPEELFRAGAVLDPAVGWFCSSACARQYELRFRVQPSRTPARGSRPAR